MIALIVFLVCALGDDPNYPEIPDSSESETPEIPWHEHTEPGGEEPGRWIHSLTEDSDGTYRWWCDWIEEDTVQDVPLA